MSLFGGIMDALFGAPKSTSEAMSKEDIAWLMDQGLTANRTDKNGLFGGWKWSQDPDGRWTQTESVNPALLPGIENLLGKVQGNQTPYESPKQFGAMMDALMGSKLERMGQPSGGYAPTDTSYQRTAPASYSPPEQPQSYFTNTYQNRGRIGQYDPRYKNTEQP